jgi:hypothetical protein
LEVGQRKVLRDEGTIVKYSTKEGSRKKEYNI